jgi:UDP-N-acetylmuramate--alanine ligase
LDLADEVILLPIYPARELPMQGVSSELILEKMEKNNKRVEDSNVIIKWIQTNYIKSINSEFGEILITAGAGDIDMMVQPIKNELNKIRA